jgi:hypothetical protein
MNHYLVEPIACTPAAGWEKGQVERQVGIMRYRLFVPKLRFTDIAELNDWLEQRCQQMGEKPHPQDKDRSINAVFSEEQRALRPAMSRFDGYYERICRVQRTSIINYDRNQYSVPSTYVGKAVSVRAYADRIRIAADDQIIAQHDRCFKRDQTIFDPWHYVPILKMKPGALRNGAPFVDWDLPKALRQLKAAYLKREGGDREFVQLLLLIQDHGLESVTVACELAIEANTTQLSVITNLIHRLVEPTATPATSIVDAPVLSTPPVANVERYDQLCREGCHA